MTKTRTLGVLLFPDFELLDVCGPLEMFANLPNLFGIKLISEHKGLVKSHQGISVQTDYDLTSAPHFDVILIPGGMGTRSEVHNQTLLNWIKERYQQSEIILSVCTGAALLAKAGVLDNHKATSNKMAFEWVKQQSEKVVWIDKARWVDDGHVITSSGVAAGIDMSLYVIAKLYGMDVAIDVANKTEYIWNQDPTVDPFYKR